MPTISLHLVSDVHLERFPQRAESGYVQTLLPSSWVGGTSPQIRCCVLAGDIGDPFEASYSSFLDEIKRHSDHVVLTSGNHEYYGHAVDRTDARIREVCGARGVVFLQQTEAVVAGIRFVGATLWTHVPDGVNADIARTHMRDYGVIRDWSVAANNAIHASHASFLREALRSRTAPPTVIVTHHPPSKRFIVDKWKDHKAAHCFSTPLDELVLLPCVRHWMCGHTHAAKREVFDKQSGGSAEGWINPVGYEGERTGFNAEDEVWLYF